MTYAIDPLHTLRSALADRYAIERELGAGGMATVYLAEDVKHHRKVAIKVLHAELSAILGPERFLKEIELTANLQHPHILPLFDSGSAGGLLYYVMPYVDGETLRDRLDRDKQLSIADAVRIASEVADALEYAHGRGVVHRDIKPENILIQNGHALVADFGIALAVQQAGGQRMTQTGLSLGTPQYMSPEQAMGEREIGARSDIYSLGAVTYEMLAGEPPFTGPSAQAIVAQVITGEPKSLTLQRKTVPVHVADAVMVALEKLPADRFASASEFTTALASSTGRVSRATRSGLGKAGSDAWPWRNLAVGTTVVALVAVAVAAWGWLRPPGTDAARPLSLSVTLPAEETLSQDGLALSPDGTRLAFIAKNPAGNPTVFVRDLADMTVRAVPHTDGADTPFFSPDGQSIAYSGGGALWKVSLNGGDPEQIPGTNDGSVDAGAGISGGDWAADGIIRYSPRFRFGLGVLAVAATGGKPRTIALPDSSAGEAELSLPQLLPDGRTLLCVVRMTGGASSSRLALVSLDNRRVRLLDVQAQAGRYALGRLVYATADGAMFAASFDPSHGKLTGPPLRIAGIDDDLDGESFALSREGTLAYAGGSSNNAHIVAVGRSGTARVLDRDLHDYQALSLSPDAKRIAVNIGERSARDIWLFEPARGSMTRLTLGHDNIYPVWSADGQRIAYSANIAGTYDILARASDGTGGVDTLVKGPRYKFPGALTADGRWLIYRQNDAKTNEDIYAISLDGNHTIRTLDASPFMEIEPELSPDGRWLAFVSDESGQHEVYVQPFSADATVGAKIQVSVVAGDEPRWDQNGKELYYRSADSLFAVPITDGRAGKPTALFADPYLRGPRFPGYDVLPGGAGFVMLQRPRDAHTDLRVVADWPGLLSRGTAP
jgi:eukaryotic-like serine/threonine-protein kinase